MTIEKALELYESAKKQGKLTRRRKLSGYLPFRGGFLLLPVPDAIPVVGDCWYYVSGDGKVGEIPPAAVISAVNLDDVKKL